MRLIKNGPAVLRILYEQKGQKISAEKILESTSLPPEETKRVLGALVGIGCLELYVKTQEIKYGLLGKGERFFE